MEIGIDFSQGLATDMLRNIFHRLDDPADLICASIVSHDWRDFVISNGLSKRLCLEMFPQLSNIVHVNVPDYKTKKLSDVGSSKSMEREILETDHKVYASLLQTLRKLIPSPVDCIDEAYSASSTDNYPAESIVNTLEPRDIFSGRASYWSSRGQQDPLVPEKLVYKLQACLCIITEICIQPFGAFFQAGNPIYSAKSVRFRMGHPRRPKEMDLDLTCLPLQGPTDDKFVWTYTSQEFSMTQENHLQHFKLPEPVLCIGGYLQIELLGRVQKQAIDGLFYICVSHVKTLGRRLCPAFDAEILNPFDGKFSLKYFPDALPQTLQSSSNGQEPETSSPVGILRAEELFRVPVGVLQYLVVGNQQDNDAIDWEDDEMDQFIL